VNSIERAHIIIHIVFHSPLYVIKILPAAHLFPQSFPVYPLRWLNYSSLSLSHYPLLELTDSHPRLVVVSAYSSVASVRPVFFGDRRRWICCYAPVSSVSNQRLGTGYHESKCRASSNGTFTSVRARARPPRPTPLEPTPYYIPCYCSHPSPHRHRLCSPPTLLLHL
jgi:hypothetical protein